MTNTISLGIASNIELVILLVRMGVEEVDVEVEMEVEVEVGREVQWRGWDRVISRASNRRGRNNEGEININQAIIKDN